MTIESNHQGCGPSQSGGRGRIQRRGLFNLPAAVIDAIRYHHERWDDRGYPHALPGKDLPLGLRVPLKRDEERCPFRTGIDSD